MKNTSFALSFAIQLFVVLSLVLALHILYHYLWGSTISWTAWSLAYLSNFGMTFLATLAIYQFRKSHTESLGYIFLAGSLIKLLAFAVFIQPLLTIHYTEKSSAFFLFFVPYAFALAVEIRVLIRLLNRL